jgi:hypothetical protein
MRIQCSDSAVDWADESGRFAIDPETGIAFGEFAGGLRPGDLLAALVTTARYRGIRSGLCALVDLRDATILWNDGDELAFRRSLYAHFPARVTGRCALLAPCRRRAPGDAAPPQAAAGSPGTETLLENLYLRVDARLFRDFGQAMRWLLPPEAAQHGRSEPPVDADAARGMPKSCQAHRVTTTAHCG